MPEAETAAREGPRASQEGGAGTHPTLRDLLRFLRGELARTENRRIVRHLLTGCPRCLAVTRSVWEFGDRIAEKGRPVARR